ncbi:hypothetical protein [Nannocystis exedens]|uniref:hypothetical protein n=1 Tax=Nannocystis exedens TaxID=54 RepID=UPI001160340A|nr:hypothetical protein [Nannocystis exedens]
MKVNSIHRDYINPRRPQWFKAQTICLLGHVKLVSNYIASSPALTTPQSFTGGGQDDDEARRAAFAGLSREARGNNSETLRSLKL